MLTTKPCVFVVGENYQIMVPVKEECLMWAKVGDDYFYDESNGILRSDVLVHRVIIPKEKLDSQKKYTLVLRKIIERKPYFTETEQEKEYTFEFKPVKSGEIRAYHIADTHNMVVPAVMAAKTYGDIDFLILNGDIPDHSGTPENIITVYEIAGEITKGNIPVVFARGNHDMRGIYADRFCDLVASDNGKFYYTFTLGDIWGIVLDCGEDKDDSHEAYGHTICCTDFRKKQTKFIEKIIENEGSEFGAEEIKKRIVICHYPFTQIREEPHNIEKETYSKWAELLRNHIKPDLMVCGHVHKTDIYEVGGEKDHLGQPCTILLGAEPQIPYGNPEICEAYKGSGICFNDKKTDIVFTDSSGQISKKHSVMINR